MTIDTMLQRIRGAIKPYPKAALFELLDDGFTSPFEQLIGCMISIRTRDETTIPVARRFFDRARDAATVATLTTAEIEKLIQGSSFSQGKAVSIQKIARFLVEKYGGKLPCNYDILVSLPGIGPKCANLILGIACDRPRIGVDIHVHRVTNRWGYVTTKTPEQTIAALEKKLPRKYWVEINALLVPFGKHICTGVSPKCSTCPVLEGCEQRGVTTHR